MTTDLEKVINTISEIQSATRRLKRMEKTLPDFESQLINAQLHLSGAHGQLDEVFAVLRQQMSLTSK
jgi:hypothetical protein